MVDTFKNVSASLADYMHVTGDVVILIVHQAIHIPRLTHSLLSTFQMRLNDAVVNEAPKFQCKRPTEFYHANSVKV
jgi:hypothetical protein